MTYSFSKKVDLSYKDALQKVTEELQKEGFGVLTEIDVRATLKKKSVVGRDDIEPIAEQVNQKLIKVIKSV